MHETTCTKLPGAGLANLTYDILKVTHLPPSTTETNKNHAPPTNTDTNANKDEKI